MARIQNWGLSKCDGVSGGAGGNPKFRKIGTIMVNLPRVKLVGAGSESRAL